MSNGNDRGGETTERVKTLRDSLKAPISELEEAIAKHAEASGESERAANGMRGDVRKRSISSDRLGKVVK